MPRQRKYRQSCGRPVANYGYVDFCIGQLGSWISIDLGVRFCHAKKMIFSPSVTLYFAMTPPPQYGISSGTSPHCDSPPFVIAIKDQEIDKHHFCMRMKHNSATATKGKLWVRKWTRSALAHWDQDPDILQGLNGSSTVTPFTPARTDYSATPWNEGDYYEVNHEKEQDCDGMMDGDDDKEVMLLLCLCCC